MKKRLLHILGLGVGKKTPAEDSAHRLCEEGGALLRAGQREAARRKLEEALALTPDHAQALHFSGILAAQEGDFARAAELIGRAAELGPPDAEVFGNLGNALRRLGRHDEAEAAYARALATDGGYFFAYLNRAQLYLERGDLRGALADLEAFLARAPDHAEAWRQQGDVLVAMKRMEEALASYRRSVALAPTFVALMNRGSTLEKLHRYEEAIADFRAAIRREPENYLAHFNLGATLLKAKNLDAAKDALDEAIRLNPSYALAWHCRANVYDKQKRYRAAIADYRRACELGAGETASPEMLLYTELKICDWSEYDELRQRVLDGIARGEEAGRPFLVLALTDALSVQRRIADTLAANIRKDLPPLPPLVGHPPHERLRIGYFSADLRNHPVAYLTAELFELHDRERFEITAFSFGPYDDLTRRVNEAVDDFIDCRTLSVEDVVKLARTLEIDIAIDLGGYTDNNRASLFALRVAPIQVSYLGFPGTMGAGMHDYLLADATLVPPECERWYAEKIVRLPVYQINDTKRAIAARDFGRAELGLPEDGFVYCCFNNPVKFNPAMFDVWADILRAVENGVLFLLADSEEANRNIVAEFVSRGIAAQRIALGDRLPRPEYLARYRACDLFLDTLPFNAGTTASDALWAGLPVLTCMGEAFASRMAGTLLTAMKLPELVATSLDDYRQRAIALAKPDSALAALRARLARSLRQGLLFDSRAVTRHIEAAYLEMYRRHRQGLPPGPLEIPTNADDGASVCAEDEER